MATTTTTTSSSTLVIEAPTARRIPRSRRSSFSSTATVNTETKSIIGKKTSTRTLKTRRGSSNASEKRNADFHALFKSIPEHDRLLDGKKDCRKDNAKKNGTNCSMTSHLGVDYGCALQKEILLQGRLYVSEQHICFNSNIFGWVTNVKRRFWKPMRPGFWQLVCILSLNYSWLLHTKISPMSRRNQQQSLFPTPFRSPLRVAR